LHRREIKRMSSGSRFLATVLAGIVWIYAGFSVASGPLAAKAITPAVPGAAVKGTLPTQR
jgi:hypothetical protein